MTGQATSPAVARWTPGEWAAFARFLRRPELPERMTGIRLAAVAATLRLFALDLLLMATLLVALGVATTFGLKIPENAIDELRFTPLVLGFVVIGAPIAEELVFRSWLSGRPGHLAAAAGLVIGVAMGLAFATQARPRLELASFALAAVLAISLAAGLRKRPAMRFFARHFAWFYFASALVFAAAHLTNYTQGMAWILLPLVVPQLIAGLIFGYARVNYGLWSDMLLHMMHNSLLIGLFLLQKGA